MEPNELENALANVQDYVDGTMPRREAMRFYLLVQRDAGLAAEVERYRAILQALDSEPREDPSARFADATILASIPFEHYRSAPRRGELWPGLERVPFLARWLHRTRRAALAAAAAYGLVLLTSHSFLAAGMARFSRATQVQLDEWLAGTAQVPLLSGIVAALSWTYDVLARSIAWLDSLFGTPLLTLALGMALGSLCWNAAAAARRRQLASRQAL